MRIRDAWDCFWLSCANTESLMRGETNHSQYHTQITDFFSADTGQSAPQQTLPHTRGILVDQAIALGRSRRPRLQQITQHRRRLHQRIRITLARHAGHPVRSLTIEEIDEIHHKPMRGLIWCTHCSSCTSLLYQPSSCWYQPFVSAPLLYQLLYIILVSALLLDATLS